MAIQLSRPDPLMRPESYKTYSVVSPISTHFRPGTCAETDCPHYLNGWGVRLENLTPDLRETVKSATFERQGRQVKYRYTVQALADGHIYLVFEAGQPCFRASQHRVRIDKPPLFLVRDGDWRGNPRRTRARQHLNPQNWVEDFAGHQQGLADEIAKG
jgi:hypothetical protein